MDKERTNEAIPEQTNSARSDRTGDRSAEKAERIRKILLIASVLAGIVLGLLLARNKPENTTEKLFQAEGFQITLATRFAETGDRGGFDRVYRSNRESVLVLREEFASDPALAGLRLEDYASRIAERIPGASAVQTEQGIPCIEYEAEYDGKPSRYLLAVYQGSDAFWQVMFVCKTGSFESYREDFLRFAASVSVE